jgi:DNA transformation protein and related proteins
MAVSDSFVAFVVEQLEPIGAIAPKRMFGAVGLYAGDLFFGIVARDVLYLKADEAGRIALERAGSHAFTPYPDRGGSMNYFSVPVSILEDADALLAWAKRSIAIARSQRTANRRRQGFGGPP